MASNVHTKDATPFGPDGAAPALSVRNVLVKILAPLASLKLTVTLMALGILLVLFGTLALQDMNEFEGMKNFFRTWICFVEYKNFFPKNFFPNVIFDRPENVTGGFYFPGGWIIGGLMALNLISAHAIRFRVQGTGTKLVSGLVMLAIGGLLTWLVIMLGPDKDGFEGATQIQWKDIHWIVTGGIFGLVIAAAAPLANLEGTRRFERGLLMAAVALLGALTVFLLYRGPEPVIDSSGLRILWQLLKGAFAGCVLLGGCILLFHKRAGVVLLHGGLLLMMSNELVVYNLHAENRLRASEGESSNVLMDMKSPELAIIDTSSPTQDDVVVVPLSLLKKSGKLHDDLLPFDVELVKYLPNSTVDPEAGNLNPATRGDRDAKIWMNNPVRYQGETFYQSDYGVGPNGVKFSVFQVVTNTAWMIPYVGCMIVAVGLLFHFSLMLVRFLKRRERETDVSSLPAAKVNFGPLASRSADDKLSRDSIPPPLPAAGADESEVNDWEKWLPVAVPLAIVLAAALGIFLAARTPHAPPDSIDLYRAGKLPVAHEGRVKPWDSLARNTLRVLANREYVDGVRESLNAKGEKQIELYKVSAIQWLLDTIAHPQAAETYRAIRIESAELLSFFGLETREGLRYSWRELKPNLTKFDDRAKALRKRKPESLGEFDRKIVDLQRNLQMIVSLQIAFRLPPEDNNADRSPVENLVSVAALTVNGGFEGLPLAVPTGKANTPWEPLVLSATREWIKQTAAKQGDLTSSAFAEKLLADMPEKDRRRLLTVRMFGVVEDIVGQMSPGASAAEIRRSALEKFKQMPDEMKLSLEKQATQEVLQQFARSVEFILKGEKLDSSPSPRSVGLRDLIVAYGDGNVARFNATLNNYEQSLAQAPPLEYNEDKIDFEAFLNNLTPFPIAKWMYITAFALAGLSWLGAHQTFRRASTWLILLTFALHTLGLAGRIYLSGRPPVTNLYSSAVFIGWGGVLLGLMLEWIYGLSLGNAIAALAGAATLAIADHLALEGETLIVMQAVLDTNFWLGTHVICVTLGYTTTYVAGLLGLVYLVGGMFTPGLDDKTAKNIIRMIYGIVCFSIFFSFVGTVLGGLWADDSWGRFWGWDPKENGALIIVLWNVLVLHARWDGIVKERGLATLAIVGNIVTSWSWFGVNQLGLGRHSYGATRSVADMLVLLVIGHALLALLSLAPKDWWWSVRAQKAAALAGKEKRPGKRDV